MRLGEPIGRKLSTSMREVVRAIEHSRVMDPDELRAFFMRGTRQLDSVLKQGHRGGTVRAEIARRTLEESLEDSPVLEP